MSDDEEYYDEFDDDGIFWVEEAEPTAADDLAAAATYDPTFQDDPSIETADFYSDWEELSDDYYDEDPTAVRRLRAMGAWPTQEPIHIELSPTKRRKLADNLPTDLTSFQGVAWKHPKDENDIVEIYAPGEGEKVSLLKNWREIFRNAKPAIERLRGRVQQYKTADMISREQSESDLDVPSLVEDMCEDEIISSDPAEAQPAKPLLSGPVHARVVVSPPSQVPVHPNKGNLGNLDGDLESNNQEHLTEQPAEKVSKEPATTASRKGRKRKASVSVGETIGQSENNTGAETEHKAKRTAASKASQAANPPSASSGSVRRSARNRK
ncbi:hypothetical protein BDW62DRAFT_151516 [Aspergillus aurantiobrunneus]